MNLVELLKRTEGKTLEFKRDLSSPEGILKCLVGFANTAGGIVVIGVEDGSKNVRGFTDVLVSGRETRKPGLRFDSSTPHSRYRSGAVAEAERVGCAGLPEQHPPALPGTAGPRRRSLHPRRLDQSKGRGDADRRVETPELDELFRRAGHPDLKSEAIDFRAASELFAPYRQLTTQAWSTLRVTTEHQGRQVPTIGGLLLFGKDRFARFPDAWIQAGRFAGIHRARLLDSAEIRSFLPRAAEEAIAFIHKHLTHESIIEGVRREDRWSVPLVAIREALMNAIVHADYAQQGAPIRIALFDDRIEIENPGLLPFGLTIEDIMQGVSKLRNRVIGRVFHELHLIEQWGSGIQRMTAACQEAGLAVPRLEEIGMHFRVTISSARIRQPNADKTDRRILTLFSDGVARSTAAVAKQLDSPREPL